MVDLTNEIRAYALKNALDFGKADSGKVMPKLFQHGLAKEKIKETMPLIIKIINEVNALTQKEKEKEFEKYKSLVKEPKEQSHELPELPNASPHMVFRLAPYPSGALHIGNAKTYLLNALYAEKYAAKTILVFDDTIGSEEKQIAPEAYKLIEDAFAWLDVSYDKKIIYKSDRFDTYYKYAEELIAKDKAYVCTCIQEKLRDNRANGKDCVCRSIDVGEQRSRWKGMFSAAVGSAVLRIKTSMQDPNPAFRDRVLFKISDRPHPRVGKKYRVWPTLEMSWGIDDHLLGVTHIIRGADLMIETDMEKFIWDIFGWVHPETIHTGLVRLEGVGAKISKSKAQKEVKSGLFSGWDDPRTWSIQSLKRRGFLPQAIREFIKDIGLNKQDITAPIESLYAINRKLIDASSPRYYFIADPITLKIKNPPEVDEIKVPVHPDKPTEFRTLEVGTVHIAKADYESHKNKEVRLLHLYNITLQNEYGATFTTHENKPIPKIQWVSKSVPCTILMPDGLTIKGLAESNVLKEKAGNMFQFERVGFVRLDKITPEGIECWFAHQ